MPDEHTPEPSRKAQIAALRAEGARGFYIHLIIYASVMVLLILVNAVSADSPWWVQWPLAGWGIGIVLHGLAAFRS